MSKPHTYAYVVPARCHRVGSAKAQAEAIKVYCTGIGHQLDGVFGDKADTGCLRMFEREAGGQLVRTLRRGDHLVVTGLDRLASSCLRVGQILDQLRTRGVIVHSIDPACVLEPHSELFGLLAQVVTRLAENERRSIGLRTSQAIASLKAEGKRFTRLAPYGYKWTRRGKETVMTPVPQEQELMRQAATFRLEGHSLDRTRQFVNYRLKARNRAGHEFGHREIRNMTLRGAELLRSEQGT